MTAGNPAGQHVFDVASSTTVYSGAILALRLDQVIMPGGQTAEREVIEHHGAVAIVAEEDNGDLVLIRQYRHPLGSRLLELPAGLLDIAGEDPLEAAKRELVEETGLAARDWSLLLDLALSPGFTDEQVRIYLARGLSSVAQPEPVHEEADLAQVRMPLAAAVQAALSGDITNACAAAGILALAAVQSGAAAPRPADSPWPQAPTRLLARQAERG